MNTIYKSASIFCWLLGNTLLSFGQADGANNEQISSDISSELGMFVGRFHPVVVHLPIGFVLFLFIVELLKFLKKWQFPQSFLRLMWLLSLGAAIFSAVLGYLLSLHGGYGEELLELHQYSSYGLIAILLVGYILNSDWVKKYSFSSTASLITVILGSFMITVVGHYGGALTHGESFLTEYAPWNTGKETKKISNIVQAKIFPELILPILEKKCISCHNADKIKGELRMDTYQWLMKGGESGAVVKPRDAEGSELYHLATLPKTEKRAMPPDGKVGLSKEELELIHWWISNGAVDTASLSSVSASPEIIKKFSKYYGFLPNEQPIISKISVPKVKDESIENIRAKNILVLRLGKEDDKLSLQLNSKMSFEEVFELVQIIQKNIVFLDVSNSELGDKDMKNVVRLENLNRLYLQNTKISDEASKDWYKLEYLEVLNLYGTNISDASITNIAKCKNLKSVYLWNTKIKKESVVLLQTKMPKLKIYFQEPNL